LIDSANLRRRWRRAKRRAGTARQLAKLAADDPKVVVDLGRGFLVGRGVLSARRPAPVEPTDHLPPPDLAGFARSAGAAVEVAATPEEVIALARDVARWPEWFALHDGWSHGPPETLEPGAAFAQRIKIMGIPAEINWTVRVVDATATRFDGTGRMGMTMSLFVEVGAMPGGARVWIDLGMDGDPLRGPMGATVQRAVQESITASAAALAGRADRRGSGTGRATGPVRYGRTGELLDPRTPVLVGAGQIVQREPGETLRDPVELSALALEQAAADSGGRGLLHAADAVYAVASASWTYRDQAALVAEAVGASPRETVMSARFGGDGAQLMINAAAQAIADGTSEVVLVAGAESGATLAAAQQRGVTPAWPQQDAGVAPTRTLGSDREANNEAEAAANLGAPIYMYALLESAVRAEAGETRAQHERTITELWSRFSAVAAGNPYAWRPQRFTATELARVGEDNRMVSLPYPKLLCANLQVDLASGLIVCSAAAAEAAGVPQDKWVFVHAGASAHDEWFVSERADLAASPAIRAIGAAALGHAGIGIGDVAHVDLYACFPSAVQIAARELGLPIDDPDRPLTVTGGLTFGGGPGNNYGGHAIATMVGRLRADPDAYGLATSLGWYVTKHAIGIYSARPPEQAYANLRPSVDHAPARAALPHYLGSAVVEAYTVPYGRDGEPEAAVLSAITPDGARALIRVRDREVVDKVVGTDMLHRRITITGPGEVTFGPARRFALPPPPPAPVLVERRGAITIITLNRPSVRNAIDRATALLLERAVDAFEADPAAQVAVLTGAGAVFCAGMDLAAAARGEFPISDHRGPLGLCGRPPAKPLIAAVEGPALAGGCELALAADLIVASRASQFGIPEAKRGLVAAAGGVLRLAQRLPRAVALELALTGDPLSAGRMAELGLVNTVVDPGTALDAALELAARIASNAPLSVAAGKRIVDESPDWTAAEAFDRQTELSTPVLVSVDAAEGIRAFAEHRQPIWTGR
jgi:acetyl-CoA C-acetyltransferase